MQRRSREVNIFNMSLLDILCGALGAFCFMMIALLPYWRPVGQTVDDIKREHDRTLQELSEIENAISKLPGKEPDLIAKLEKLRSQLKNLEAKRQREVSDRKQLQEKADRADELAKVEPVTITMPQFTIESDVDLYVRLLVKLPDNSMMALPDPTKMQSVRFTKETYLHCGPGLCTEIWTSNNTEAGRAMEVYVKLMKPSKDNSPVPASVAFTMNSKLTQLPKVNMIQEKPVVKIGVIQFLPNQTASFVPEAEFAEAFNKMEAETAKPAESKQNPEGKKP